MAGQRTTVAAGLTEIEVTYGVDPIPTAADAFLVENFLPPTVANEPQERPGLTSFPINEPHVQGKRKYESSFDVEVKGGGTNDVPPEWAKLLRACAFAETINAATSVVWTPDMSVEESVATRMHQDGKLHNMLGSRGSWSIAAGSIGERMLMSFAFMSLYLDPTDTAIPGSLIFDTTEPPVFLGGTFTWGGFSACLRSFSLDAAIEIAERENLAAATGFKEFTHTKFVPTGSIQVEDEFVADQAWESLMLADTTTIVQAIFGTAGGNRFTFDMPVVRVESLTPGEESGIAVKDITFRPYDSVGNDWLSITHD